MRNIWLISRTIWIEAIRRREIYAIVIVSVVLIVSARSLRFFGLEDFSRFYREIALQTMNLATSLTVILLAARQLPREFENHTIYPLLARPVGRAQFLLGKFLGVLIAAVFCYTLFMAIFAAGTLLQRVEFNWLLFAQFVYLQLWAFTVLAALTCFLSLLMKTVDAAITLTLILYFCSRVFMNVMSTLYDYVDRLQQIAIILLHYVIPQLTLFDASAKVVHSSILDDGATVLWPNLAAWALVQLTLYGAAYTALYLALAWLLFRRRPL
jgi:ABC-type transport system involved in multi-copper enzyme maturation permease subunit